MKVMDAIFLNHGGGPLPLMGDASHRKLIEYLSKAASKIPKPDAILIASAHWEESMTTFLGASQPGPLYDYYGFPPECYKIDYAARNSQPIIDAARKLLTGASITSRIDQKRSHDHGVFVPLKLMYPDAGIPVVQISLPSNRDPGFVYELGKALAPLREQGVLILGSGLSYHNLPSFFQSDEGKKSKAAAFDKALQGAMLSDDRKTKLAAWESFPHARFCHPTEDHLMPLVFVAGAGEGDACSIPYEDTLMGAKVSGFSFKRASN